MQVLQLRQLKVQRRLERIAAVSSAQGSHAQEILPGNAVESHLRTAGADSDEKEMKIAAPRPTLDAPDEVSVVCAEEVADADRARQPLADAERLTQVEEEMEDIYIYIYIYAGRGGDGGYIYNVYIRTRVFTSDMRSLLSLHRQQFSRFFISCCKCTYA
jgi:hypothetical protein